MRVLWKEAKAVVLGNPTFHYCLLMVLGAWGVWISMPLYAPQTTVESVDLVINLIIFVPSIMVAVGSGFLALLSATVSLNPDRHGWFATSAQRILTAFGLSGLMTTQLVSLGPFAVLRDFIAAMYEAFAGDSAPAAVGDGDPDPSEESPD